MRAHTKRCFKDPSLDASILSRLRRRRSCDCQCPEAPEFRQQCFLHVSRICKLLASCGFLCWFQLVSHRALAAPAAFLVRLPAVRQSCPKFTDRADQRSVRLLDLCHLCLQLSSFAFIARALRSRLCKIARQLIDGQDLPDPPERPPKGKGGGKDGGKEDGERSERRWAEVRPD